MSSSDEEESNRASVPLQSSTEGLTLSPITLSGAPDSPNAHDNEEIITSPTEDDRIETEQRIPNPGLNLALLLPFLSQMMTSSLDSNDRSNPEQPLFPELEIEHLGNQSHWETEDPMDVWTSDLPFFPSRVAEREEANESRANIYVKQCLGEFLEKEAAHHMGEEIDRAKEQWKDTMRCLRTLDWQRVQM
jgi:hypothetical protein